jgi:acyl-CoA thioester hydrolase
MAPFERTLAAGWGDMDFNAHMANTAYLDKAADVRMMFLASTGLTMDELHRLHVGPVVMRDEVDYFREVRMMEALRVTYRCAGLAEDRSRFRVCNEFWREDGTLAARVTSTGGWFDLSKRKLVVPPPPIRSAIESLERTPDFEVLPSSIREAR